MDIAFLILTNRGHLKCYRTVEHDNQQLNLELVEEVNFPEAHRRRGENFSDDAGRYHDSPAVPNNGAVNTSSYNENNRVDFEIERRIDHDVAERIQSLLGKNPPPWALAAPETLLARLKNVLKVSVVTQCVGMIPKDIVNAPVDEIREHVRAALEQTV
jgi:protein required for attachment to host cells